MIAAQPTTMDRPIFQSGAPVVYPNLTGPFQHPSRTTSTAERTTSPSPTHHPLANAHALVSASLASPALVLPSACPRPSAAAAKCQLNNPLFSTCIHDHVISPATRAAYHCGVTLKRVGVDNSRPRSELPRACQGQLMNSTSVLAAGCLNVSKVVSSAASRLCE